MFSDEFSKCGKFKIYHILKIHPETFHRNVDVVRNIKSACRSDICVSSSCRIVAQLFSDISRVPWIFHHFAIVRCYEMPFIGLYTWTEKDDVIKIVIPLKGASPNKVDIYVTSSTLKVNFSPYIVEIILQFPIDPIKHKANIKNGNLRVTLFKTEESVGFWGSLEVDTEDKSAIMKLREDSIVAQDALERELGESRRDRRTDDERFSLRKQMGLDEAERNRLDNLKLEEKKTAEEEVYATFSLMQAEKQRGSQKVVRAELSQPKLDPVYTSEPIDFETYSREKKTEVSSDIFDLSKVSVIDMTKGDFEDEDTDYSGAVGIPTSRSSSSINPVKYALVHVIEDEVNDVRYIPPPRLTSTAADGKGDMQFF